MRKYRRQAAVPFAQARRAGRAHARRGRRAETVGRRAAHCRSGEPLIARPRGLIPTGRPVSAQRVTTQERRKAGRHRCGNQGETRSRRCPTREGSRVQKSKKTPPYQSRHRQHVLQAHGAPLGGQRGLQLGRLIEVVDAQHVCSIVEHAGCCIENCMHIQSVEQRSNEARPASTRAIAPRQPDRPASLPVLLTRSLFPRPLP